MTVPAADVWSGGPLSTRGHRRLPPRARTRRRDRARARWSARIGCAIGRRHPRRHAHVAGARSSRRAQPTRGSGSSCRHGGRPGVASDCGPRPAAGRQRLRTWPSPPASASTPWSRSPGRRPSAIATHEGRPSRAPARRRSEADAGEVPGPMGRAGSGGAGRHRGCRRADGRGGGVRAGANRDGAGRRGVAGRRVAVEGRDRRGRRWLARRAPRRRPPRPGRAGRPLRRASTARFGRTRSAVPAGCASSAGSGSAPASPTTWASARRPSCIADAPRRAGRRADAGGLPDVGARQLAARGGALRADAAGACPPRRRAARGDERRSPSAAPHDVVLTTYALVARDVDAPRAGRRGRRLVLDEAQHIKNPGTAQAQAVRRSGAGRRIALTGTPVENRLGELWSLMDVLNPGPARHGRDVPRALRRADRARRRRRGGRAPAADHRTVRPAPAEDRPVDHRRPARQDRA